jgi:hypothetical protein
MGFQVGSQCFDSAESALQFMAASMFGTGSNSGAPFSYYSIVDGSNIVTLSSNNAQTILTPQLLPCQLYDEVDATALSFAVFGVLAAAWYWRVMKMTLHANTKDDG